MKKTALAIVLMITLIVACLTALADYPEHAIQMVVCRSAGGDTDTYARQFAEKLQQVVGKPIVVVNTSGGSGAIGINSVLSAEHDGYTMLFDHTSLTSSAASGALSHYVSEDFDIVANPVIDATSAWFVPTDSPLQTVQDLVEAAKANPDQITYATEVGASTYAALLRFQDLTGVKLHAADVGTAAEKLAAVIGGNVDIGPFQWVVGKEYVEAGQLRPLGTLAAERPLAVADYPTFTEQGVPLVNVRYFVAGFAKGTDESILQFWKDAFSKVCADEEFQKAFFEANGAEIIPDPIGAYADWIAQEDEYRSMESLLRK